MSAPFLIYGSSGFVGSAIARLAVQRGLRPILAARNASALQAQAEELGLEYRAVHLEDRAALDKALSEVIAVLHCAGPFIHTFQPMVEGCLRTGTHYLDLTGELPVYQALATFDPAAKARNIMILPGAGFDVVATDCLAAHLKRRLPSASSLALAFHNQGPAGPPPGTRSTLVELLPYRVNVRRRNGRLEPTPRRGTTRLIDFGNGPVQATMVGWGDVFMAYYSTGIPTIEDYLVLSVWQRRLLPLIEVLRPLLRLPAMRSWLKRRVRAAPNSTAAERHRTTTTVWGEVRDGQGRRRAARLHGPEAGVNWTVEAALAIVTQTVAGHSPCGFQTPARAYGADVVLACAGVTREDLD